MISTSEISISCIIKKKFAEKAVKALHEKFGLGK
jgi:aspartokinase